jgi:PEP-CTERM motif
VSQQLKGGIVVRSGKTWSAIVLLCVAGCAASGAPMGLASFGYQSPTVVPYSWIDNTAAGIRVLANDDDATVTANIGFEFKFFGSSYTSVGISSNGLITFGGVNDWPVPVDMTTTALPADLPTIAALWDDWSSLKNVFPSSDGVYYGTIGTPGNREFVVEWNNMFACCPWGTSPVTFEAVLFEGTNNILFQYATTTSGITDGIVGDANDHGATAGIGIRDSAGQLNGRVAQFSFARNLLSDREAVLFSPCSVPEPSTWLLMGFGLGAIRFMRRRRS